MISRLLCFSLVLLLGGASHAASYEAKKDGISTKQFITGERGEGIQVIRSPSRVANARVIFMCERTDAYPCALMLDIAYEDAVDNTGAPLQVIVDGKITESPFARLVSVSRQERAYMELIIVIIANSIGELKAARNIRVLTGSANKETEVVVEASKFDLFRLVEK